MGDLQLSLGSFYGQFELNIHRLLLRIIGLFISKQN